MRSDSEDMVVIEEAERQMDRLEHLADLLATVAAAKRHIIEGAAGRDGRPHEAPDFDSSVLEAIDEIKQHFAA